MIINVLGKWIIIAIVAVVVVAGGVFYFREDPMNDDININVGTDSNTSAPSMNGGFGGDPIDQALNSLLGQYKIVSSQNKMPETCAVAAMIAGMYLQKQDAASYASWDANAKACEAAYMKSQQSDY